MDPEQNCNIERGTAKAKLRGVPELTLHFQIRFPNKDQHPF
jgi:hypothetical protein